MTRPKLVTGRMFFESVRFSGAINQRPDSPVTSFPGVGPVRFPTEADKIAPKTSRTPGPKLDGQRSESIDLRSVHKRRT